MDHQATNFDLIFSLSAGTEREGEKGEGGTLRSSVGTSVGVGEIYQTNGRRNYHGEIQL